MIKSIRLTNFFSFKDETIDFEQDVNLMIGINGAGKSNLFKAIQLLKTGVIGNSESNALFRLMVEEWGGFDNIFFKGATEKNGSAKIALEFVFDYKALPKISNYRFNGDIRYKIEIIRKNDFGNYYLKEKIWTTHPAKNLLWTESGLGEILKCSSNNAVAYAKFEVNKNTELFLSTLSNTIFDFDEPVDFYPVSSLKEGIKKIMTYEYFDTTKNSKIRRAASANATTQNLLPNGGNLPQLLHTLKLKNKVTYRQIVQHLQDINPNFNSFDFNLLGSGQMEMYLDENKLDSAIHLAHISDGTLRYLCLLSIFLNPNRGKFICIDELEMGLHPDMIFSIFKLIEEAALDTTFLISTHSPAILNKFRIAKIRVLEKNEINATTVKQFSEEDFTGWYEEFNPGKMWTSGDFGGTRW